MIDLFWPGDQRAGDVMSDAAADVLAEQRSMTELTWRPACSDYLGASDHLVDAVLQRARRHLKVAT